MYYLGEETSPHLVAASFQTAVVRDKVLSQHPFFQATQPQLPQLRFLRPVPL